MMRPSPIGEVLLLMDTRKPCLSTSTRRRYFRWRLAVEVAALAAVKEEVAVGRAVLPAGEP